MHLTDIEVPKIHAEPIGDGHRLRQTPALVAAREWRKSDSPLLVLAGLVGTGKSLAAAWALWDWWTTTIRTNPVNGHQWGHKGRCWISAPHLARMRKWADEVRALESAPALVLDDLGEESSTDASVEILQNLVTTRFAERRPTVVTTNLDRPTFKSRYGMRIVDRVRECGLDENGHARWWVTCSGESLRGVCRPEPHRNDTDIPEVANG